jgi:hypothetical protein
MKDEFEDYRSKCLNNPDLIAKLEKSHASFFLASIFDSIEEIERDFNQAGNLKNFWLNNPPRNRGYAPKGDKIPWSEVGETTLTPNVVRAVLENDSSVEFPGLPSGADTRFLLDDHLVHFDVKATGPTDLTDEVVASPNQISGDGLYWTDEGVDNSEFDVYGPRGGHTPFHPELSPIYKINGSWGLCETFFLKAVYEVKDRGEQPLSHLELVCVPNGLLLFEGPKYAEKLDDLLRPGKDTQGTAKPRTRVKFDPLSRLASWRTIQIHKTNGSWTWSSRSGQTQDLFS